MNDVNFERIWYFCKPHLKVKHWGIHQICNSWRSFFDSVSSYLTFLMTLQKRLSSRVMVRVHMCVYLSVCPSILTSFCLSVTILYFYEMKPIILIKLFRKFCGWLLCHKDKGFRISDNYWKTGEKGPYENYIRFFFFSMQWNAQFSATSCKTLSKWLLVDKFKHYWKQENNVGKHGKRELETCCQIFLFLCFKSWFC